MAKKKAAAQEETVVSYKGFTRDLTCRGFQYEVGQTYTHEGVVKACEEGFHACENPLDVFAYYGPAESRYAIVEQSGQLSRRDDDTKIASAVITIKAEVSLPTLVQRGVDWIMSRLDKSLKQTNTGDQSAATNTGDQSAATNTGYQSAATNTGYQSAATNTGDWSAATNTGNRSAATNTGNRSAASVEGKGSVAIVTGYQGKTKACAGSAIVLCYRDDDGKLIHIRAAMVGQDDIRPDVWYRLDEHGNFVEVDE